MRAYFCGPIPVVVMQRAADRTHLALDKDSPATRHVLPPGRGQVIARPRVGGLQHRYDRRAA